METQNGCGLEGPIAKKLRPVLIPGPVPQPPYRLLKRRDQNRKRGREYQKDYCITPIVRNDSGNERNTFPRRRRGEGATSGPRTRDEGQGGRSNRQRREAR